MILYLLNLMARVRQWRLRRRSLVSLARYNDRMLKDIGMTRDQIQRLLSEPFWRH
ncbi:MAG: DUF1127 domain-containing protein [Rhodospirillales bacterium]|nr:DUF1127 domain-containing protein [Rhodospirillales bacterium]